MRGWLWVSSFRRHVWIPVSDIEFIDEIRWLTIHPIRLYLVRKSELGDRIVFMPSGLGLPFVSHPLVGELTRQAEVARWSSSSQSHEESSGAVNR